MNKIGQLIIGDGETSGLSPIENGLLSWGAVDYLTGDEFYGECYLTRGRVATKEAMDVNDIGWAKLTDYSLIPDTQLVLNFFRWAKPRAKILGGHNVGHFDILFLEEIYSRFPDEFKAEFPKFPFSYRTVDLHSVGYAKWGESLTHSQICEKLGLEPEPKPHNALEGAKSETAAFKAILGY